LGLKELFLLRLAKRWISGVDLDSAISDATKANSKGMGVVVNFLGEDIRDPVTADAQMDEYLRLQQAIADRGIDGFASVKLTQLGLGADTEGARSRLERIATNSEELGQNLWLDMEASKFTEETLSIYQVAHERHRSMGVALQAYMRRSESDLASLLDKGGRVRLVKGAYREDPGLVFRPRKEVRDNFAKLMRMLFEKGDGFAIGTHDSILVEGAKRLAESNHAEFRFEMLKGIRNELKEELVKSGYKVFEYLPYGDRWYSYSKRRITEHPSNILILARSLF